MKFLLRFLLRLLLLWLLASPVIMAGQAKSGPAAAGAPLQPAKTIPQDPLLPALQEGNQALASAHYDDAIAAYDRGIAIAPTHYNLFLNKAMALRLRAALAYNQSLGPNRDQKTKDAIQRDWLAAIESAGKAVSLAEASSRSAPAQERAVWDQRRLNTLEEKAQDVRLLGENFDQTRLPEAASLYHAAAEAAKDAAKKNQLRNLEALILMETLDFAKSLGVSRSVLENDPENLDALFSATMASLGAEDFKSCTAYGTRFLKAAPASDRRRAEIKETLDAIPK